MYAKRPSKFRGRCGGTWYFGALDLTDKSKPTITDRLNELVFDIESETWGEYIGINDNKEHEVYEGDILLVSYRNIASPTGYTRLKGIVNYDVERFCFSLSTPHGNIPLLNFYDGNHKSLYLEVLGNIYDDPQMI